ncbi:restriction endonuclease subunit S [Bacteroides cellulosilyticus]|nr:restriction endonuclease subunit S [Bacteroides cellulosilyticus]MBN9710889.1 restriction endonuclease subunit S [Bacteroides cellulosilyticus]MDC7303197.1 restriction endonuclease subunit S [Bacteroides cellulosilyticus DSM 14838]
MEEIKTYKLGDVVNILDSKRVPLSSMQRQQRKGVYPYYGAQGIIDYIDDYIFDGEYLLIAEDGENLKSQKQDIAQIAKGKYWVNNHAHIIESNGLCNIQYICYLLNRIDLSGYITGSAQPKLNQDNLRKIEITLPPLKEQCRIAEFLNQFDNKIELNRRINDNLEQQAQALFKSWFVDFEPFKDGKFVNSEFGMIPEGWKISELKSICSLITKGITPQYDESSNQLVIGQKCIRGRKIDLSIARKHIPKQINEKWVQYGDVLINSTGIGTLGRPAQVWFQKKNVTVDSHVTIVRTNRQNDKMFIGQYFLGKQILLESYATGSTGQADLSKELLAMTKLVYPTDKVLNDFNKIITNMVLKIVELQTETEYLSSLRNTLLPQLMSGELKINETTR